MNGELCSGGCGIGEDVDHLMVGCVDVQLFWSIIINCYYGTKQLNFVLLLCSTKRQIHGFK
jgi:hypothetical protein